MRDDGRMSSSEPSGAPRKPRHLIDFDAPRERRDAATVRAEEERLQTVQKWVLSTLTATTVMHLAVGIVVAALFLDSGRPAQLALCVIAAAFGMIAIALARAIHGVRLVSPWLAVGLIPAVVGVILVVR